MQLATECRLCGSGLLEPVVRMSDQALCCHYPLPGQQVPSYPMTVMLCSDCKLAQLKETVPPKVLYAGGYGYRSGQTMTMTQHLMGLVDQIDERYQVNPGDVVIDIGCNDGTLLRGWGSKLHRVGYDMTVWPKATTYEEFHCGPFRANAYQAKVITAIAMFYDLANPVQFLKDARESLTDDGVLVIEMIYAGTILDGAWDMINHEHLCFYTLKNLSNAAARAGLFVVDASLNESNGGSLRAYLQPRAGTVSESCKELQERERTTDWSARWLELEDQIRRDCDKLRQEVKALVDAGRPVAALGASQKGNVVLQESGIGPMLSFASERDSSKVGRVTPGSNVPIVAEQDARLSPPDAYVVLPWHFRDEILKREAAYLEDGGTFLFPLPRFDEVKNVA